MIIFLQTRGTNLQFQIFYTHSQLFLVNQVGRSTRTSFMNFMSRIYGVLLQSERSERRLAYKFMINDRIFLRA
jgi:hypothetical protein